MPHDKPEEKEWLHLRDAICLGEVDAIVDELFKHSILVTYVEMEEELTSLKTKVGWDACAVVDKDAFQESINHLITQTISIPQPVDTQVDSYRESMVESRWDKIFDDMVGRASGRIEAGPAHYTDDERQHLEAGDYDSALESHNETHHSIRPIGEGRIPVRLPPGGGIRFQRSRGTRDVRSEGERLENEAERQRIREAFLRAAKGEAGPDPSHYTDETPEGALEAMERRLAGVLAQMDLRVGELAEAVRQMGEMGIPIPVVEAIQEVVETVEKAAESVEEATEELKGRVTPRTLAIRDYIRGLGKEVANQKTRQDIIDAVAEAHPELGTPTGGDVGNALRPLLKEGFTLLSRRGKGRGRKEEPPVEPPVEITVEEPPVEVKRKRARPKGGKTLAIESYMRELGKDNPPATSNVVAQAVMKSHPELGEISDRDVLNAIRGIREEGFRIAPSEPGVPKPRKRRAAEAEAAPVEAAPVEAAPPTPEVDPDAEKITNYMQDLGQDLGNMTSDEVASALGVTRRQVIDAWNDARFQRRGFPMMRGTSGPLPGGGSSLEDLFNQMDVPERIKALLPAAMDDPTEETRRQLQQVINAGAYEREELERIALSMGFARTVWDTRELSAAFEVLGFLAPFVGVVRKSDGQRGSLLFQHYPRYYWGFTPQGDTRLFPDQPGRQRRNGGSWSRKYYPGLTEDQHDVNDAWFQGMLDLLKPDGYLGIPELQRAFNKQGEEIPWPGESEIRPNRMIEDPPASVEAAWS